MSVIKIIFLLAMMWSSANILARRCVKFEFCSRCLGALCGWVNLRLTSRLIGGRRVEIMMVVSDEYKSCFDREIWRIILYSKIFGGFLNFTYRCSQKTFWCFRDERRLLDKEYKLCLFCLNFEWFYQKGWV